MVKVLQIVCFFITAVVITTGLGFVTFAYPIHNSNKSDSLVTLTLIGTLVGTVEIILTGISLYIMACIYEKICECYTKHCVEYNPLDDA